MRKSLTILFLAAAAILPACASTRSEPSRSTELAADHAMNASLRRVSSMQRPGPNQAYVIDPPDVISITVKDNKDISETGITVGPDGMISRPLIGDVRVGGRTVAEVREEMRQRYAKYIRDPEITVAVTAFRSKWIYVDGEVRNPGRYPYTGSDSVVNALAQAGFLTRRASPDGIHIARGNPNDPEIYPVRYKDIAIDDDSRTNWVLGPEDIVYVPPTFMSKLGYAIEEVLFPLNSLVAPASAVNSYGEYRDRQSNDR
jgi:polysaccharide export outer membrane protein